MPLSVHSHYVTGVATSSVESFAASNHQVSQDNMQDPMADYLNGHQNMNENVKICKVSVYTANENIRFPIPINIMI